MLKIIVEILISIHVHYCNVFTFSIGFTMMTNNISPFMAYGQEQQQSTTIPNFSPSNTNNNKIIQQETITSIPNPWLGHKGHQIATILSKNQ